MTFVLSLAPLIDRYAFITALAVGVIAWFAFRQSLAALAICLGGLVGIHRRRHRARGFVCQRRADATVLLSAGGEVALVGVLSFHVIGCGPAPQTHGSVAGGTAMNGWRLVGTLSLLLGAMSVYFVAGDGSDVDGVRLAIRATARTSVVLFALAFTAAHGRAAAVRRPTRLAAPQPPLSRRLLRRLAFHPPRRDPRARRARPRAVLEAHHRHTIVLAGTAYVFIAAMTATSFDRTAAWLGPRRWRLLHLIGGWYIWISFAVAVGKRVPLDSFYWPMAILVWPWRWSGWSPCSGAIAGGSLSTAQERRRDLAAAVDDTQDRRFITIVVTAPKLIRLHFAKDTVVNPRRP